ncbi:hypothetical protein AGMMS50239_21160 [Bacteroidia bacterium]|nr:hypothetical protein AGMMS50239_21160 [Bacteroidia bacterium]
MEALRRIVDTDTLKTLLSLPESFRSKQVEIIVLPVVENKRSPQLTKSAIDNMLQDSITQSLIGSVPLSNISLDDIKKERLQKHENID